MQKSKFLKLAVSFLILASPSAHAIGKRNASSWSQLAVLGSGESIALWDANGFGARILVYDSTTGQKVTEFKASSCLHEGNKLAASADGSVLLFSTDSIHQCIDAFDFKTGKLVFSNNEDIGEAVDQYAVSPSGKKWAVRNTFSRTQDDSRADYSRFDEIQFINESQILANRCGYDDYCLLMGPHSGVGIYDLEKQKWLLYPKVYEGPTTYMSNFSINGGIALNWSQWTREGTPPNPILIFSDSLRLIQKIPNAGNFKFAKMSPAGNTFVTFSDEIKIWTVLNPKPFSTGIKELAGIQYSPDGNNLIVLSKDQKQISVLRAKDGKILRTVVLE